MVLPNPIHPVTMFATEVSLRYVTCRKILKESTSKCHISHVLVNLILLPMAKKEMFMVSKKQFTSMQEAARAYNYAFLKCRDEIDMKFVDFLLNNIVCQAKYPMIFSTSCFYCRLYIYMIFGNTTNSIYAFNLFCHLLKTEVFLPHICKCFNSVIAWNDVMWWICAVPLWLAVIELSWISATTTWSNASVKCFFTGFWIHVTGHFVSQTCHPSPSWPHHPGNAPDIVYVTSLFCFYWYDKFLIYNRNMLYSLVKKTHFTCHKIAIFRKLIICTYF